jgi:hypothetical protein
MSPAHPERSHAGDRQAVQKQFYDRLGEDVANELVEWFNAVDATYRAGLRELNELNFARFDAKLEQRAAALEAKLEQRTAALDAKIDRRAAEIEAKLDATAALLNATLERRLGEQTRWLFAAWATLLMPVIGLWFRQ